MDTIRKKLTIQTLFYHFPFFVIDLNFEEIYIEESFKSRLIQYFSGSKIHHALLLQSESLETALPIVKACLALLFCSKKTEGVACKECPSCKKIQKNVHPDIHFSFPTVSLKSGKAPTSDDFIQHWREFNSKHLYFTPEQWTKEIAEGNKQSNITHEECKNIARKLSLKSFEGDYKVSIIYQAELLGEASNRLLKLIEEPPENTLFFLLVQDLQKILPTLLSRCQLLKIPNPSEVTLSNFLMTHWNIPKTKAQELAWQSKGRVSEAIALYQKNEDLVQSLAIEWLRKCYSFDVPHINQIIDQLQAQGRQQVGPFLSQLIELFYLTFRYQHQRLSEEHRAFPFVANFSKVLSPKKIDVIQMKINQTAYYIKRNAHMKIALFALFLEIHKQLTLKSS